jgi:hypothetical protein
MLPTSNGGLLSKTLYLFTQDYSIERVSQLMKKYSTKYPSSFGNTSEKLNWLIVKQVKTISDIKLEEIETYTKANNIKIIILDNLYDMCQEFNNHPSTNFIERAAFLIK